MKIEKNNGILKNVVKLLALMAVMFLGLNGPEICTCVNAATTEALRTENYYLFKKETMTITMDATYNHMLSDKNGKSLSTTKNYAVNEKNICKAELSGNNNKTLTLTATSNTGTVTVYVWNGDGSKLFRKITIRVMDDPKISLDHSVVSMWENDIENVIAGVNETGDKVKYNWISGSKTIVKLSNIATNICNVMSQNISDNSVVTLTCTATVYGSKSNKTATKTINVYVYRHTEITNTDTDLNFWIGDEASVEMKIKGNDSIYTWGLSSGNLNGAILNDTDKIKVGIDSSAVNSDTEFKLLGMAKYTCGAGTDAPVKEFRVKLYKKPTIVSITNQYQNLGNKKSSDVYIYQGQSANITVKTSGHVTGYSWESSNEGLALKNADKSTCTVSGLKAGEYKISVNLMAEGVAQQLKDIVTEKKSINVHVYESPVINLYDEASGIKADKISICSGESKYISLTVNNLSGDSKVKNIKAVSSDSGKMEAEVEDNKIKIIGKNSSYEDYVKLSVSVVVSSQVSENNGEDLSTFTELVYVTVLEDDYIPVLSIEADDSDRVLTPGQQIKLNAVALPFQASTRQLAYKSDDSSIATVDDNGLITAVSTGKTCIEIVSTDGSKVCKTINVKVINTSPEFLEIREIGDYPMLTWRSVTGTKAYSLYKSENGQDYKKIATLTDECSYVDKNAKYGIKYKYALISESEIGSEFDSDMSLETMYERKLKTPGNVKAKNKKNKIVLTWSEASSAKYFIVYRSLNKNSGYKEIARTAKKTYEDNSVIAGKKYFYKICAVADKDKSKESAVVAVKHRLLKPVIESARATRDGINIKIAKTKYDGYMIYMGKNSKNRKMIGDIKTGKASLYTPEYKGAYCVWVRAYKKVGAKKILSRFSNVRVVCF